ncbi:hypothetical protein [Sulfurimonas sp.]|uniref:hypothetical protein n=1 Tax=Sulfurimonas sp. TaxID=2022749 RepID=UPI003565304F
MMKIISIALLFSVLFSGCATIQLWEDPKYKETFEEFLITEDGSKLVILGEKYHYIFSTNEKLKEILLSNKRKNIKPVFEDFKVDINNSIQGKYNLFYNTNDKESKNDIWLEKIGFETSKRASKKIFTYKYSGSMKGVRYLPKEPIISKYKFNNKYNIYIEEEPTTFYNTGRALLTPITVAEDGALIYGTTVLLVVSSPLILPMMAIEHVNGKALE